MSPRLPGKVIGESKLGGKVQRFDKVRGRKTGAKVSYNYLSERVKLAEMLKRPVWMEYPEGEEEGMLAAFPLIHASLGNGVEIWIADDNEGIGLLGFSEYDRLRSRPDAQWVVIIEQEQEEIARQTSENPTEDGLVATLRAALKQASETN